MGESGIFRINPLQAWQKEAILKAAAFLREKFGNPPADPAARQVHDGLLEVLDPARRTVRLQKEMAEASRKATMTAKVERRTHRDRRTGDRRRVNLGPPSGVPERRKGERRHGDRRRHW
jgi:hypothetical protein